MKIVDEKYHSRCKCKTLTSPNFNPHRHKEMAPKIYKNLDDTLRNDPRLKDLL